MPPGTSTRGGHPRHIDHSGRIPLLVKQGFTGNIYCTRLTGQLLSIMLRDSAHIQESDAQWQNQKASGRGGAGGTLYTVHDAEEAVKRIESGAYDVIILNFANCDMVGHTGVYEAALEGRFHRGRVRGQGCGGHLQDGRRVSHHRRPRNAEHMVDEKGEPSPLTPPIWFPSISWAPA